jgi:hypothetical protein
MKKKDPAIMTSDVLLKKDVHLHINKDVYGELRAFLYRYDLTINEIFLQLVSDLIEENDDAMSFLEKALSKKARKNIEKVVVTGASDVGSTTHRLVKAEDDAIYDLIADESVGIK